MARKHVAWIALVCALALVAGVALASCAPKNALETIKKKGKIVVGTSADYPPFEYVDAETGGYTGFDVELMEKIAEKLGVTVEWKDMDFDILLNSLQQGQINCVIACMTITAERQQQALFSKPYWTSPDAFLVKKGSGLSISDPVNDLAGKRIGVQTGTIQENWVRDELIATGKIAESNMSSYPKADAAVLDLVAGRVDVVFMDAGVAESYAAIHPVEVALVYDLPGDPGIAMKLGEQELCDEINRIIDELTEDGTILQLAEKYDIAQALLEG